MILARTDGLELAALVVCLVERGGLGRREHVCLLFELLGWRGRHDRRHLIWRISSRAGDRVI